MPAGQIPVGVVVSPDGNSVYVADAGGTVLQYDVGPSGALSPKNAAPITSVPAPSGLAISPDGRSVYVSNYGTQAANTALVYQFNVLTGGGLSPKTPATVTADDGPSSVTLSPDGESVYVTNDDGGHGLPVRRGSRRAAVPEVGGRGGRGR